MTLTDTSDTDSSREMTNCSEVIRRTYGVPEVKGTTTLTEYQQYRAKLLNDMPGGLDGCDCTVCRNKGVNYFVVDDEIVSRECPCIGRRRSVWSMRESGLGDLLEVCFFDNYECAEPWQKKALETAREFSETQGGEWLFAGGQNGSGKTHLCTAVCKRFMERGFKVCYVLWSDIFQKMQALRFKDEEYAEFMNGIRAAEILYIDDFWKAERGDSEPKPPASAEIKAGYDIINARALQRKEGKRTIISSEYYLSEIIGLDTATGGRIKQKCGGRLIQIERHPERDYRQRRKT